MIYRLYGVKLYIENRIEDESKRLDGDVYMNYSQNGLTNRSEMIELRRWDNRKPIWDERQFRRTERSSMEPTKKVVQK